MSSTTHPSYDAASLQKRGEGRARTLPRRLGINRDLTSDERVIEIGCGFGETTAALRRLYACSSLGIDPWPRWRKGPYADNEELYRELDITSPDARNLGTFDFAHSYDVWEHMRHPRSALERLYELLKPSGRAYMRFNLHRGASASHLMRYLDFPWVHLIHSDEEIRQMMREKWGLDRGAAWVNKLTYAHYLLYFSEIGFKTLRVWYDRRPMDPAFYKRYEKQLSPYPIEDLERNFMHVLLEK